MKRIFSGVQPTGNLHLGNYLGAIRNFVALQEEYECIYCVVDLHAITVWQDPAILAANTREVTAAYLAAGVDPDRRSLVEYRRWRSCVSQGWRSGCPFPTRALIWSFAPGCWSIWRNPTSPWPR